MTRTKEVTIYYPTHGCKDFTVFIRKERKTIRPYIYHPTNASLCRLSRVIQASRPIITMIGDAIDDPFGWISFEVECK